MHLVLIQHGAGAMEVGRLEQASSPDVVFGSCLDPIKL
jgi:hypothetical protein